MDEGKWQVFCIRRTAGCLPASRKGYVAITYSVREKDMIINYIKNQKNIIKQSRQLRDHDEFKRLLLENEIDPIAIGFDEKYLL